MMAVCMVGAVQITAYAATTAKSVSLSTTTYTYDGKVKKPKVTAKDKKGKKIAAKYYTVKYPSAGLCSGASGDSLRRFSTTVSSTSTL